MGNTIGKITGIYDDIIGKYQTDFDAIILSGSNPKRPIMGEKCKALLPYYGKPMVYHVVKAFSQCEDIGKIILPGPKSRLEDTLCPLFEKEGITNYEIIAEGKEGDATEMINNLVHGIERIDQNKKYALVSGCDIPRLTKDSLEVILRDTVYKMISDKMSDNLGDFYWTMGNQVEEKEDYIGLSDVERPGMVFNDYTVLRIGTIHLFDFKKMISIKDDISEVVSYRKIKEDVFGTVKYARERLGKQGVKDLLRLTSNYLKKYGRIPIRMLLSLAPYYNVPIHRVENCISHAAGAKLRFVVTKGTSDIDHDKEYEAMLKQSKKARNPIQRVTTPEKHSVEGKFD